MAALIAARSNYSECEKLDLEHEAPYDWACLRWNIADLAIARCRLEPDPAHLVEAHDYVTRARAFFVEGSDYQTELCDELLTKIDAAEAA